MHTQFKSKILTIIANSKITESQEAVLVNYVNTLADRDLIKLVTIFDKEPKSVAIYADYIQKLKEESQPVSPEKLEEILTPLLSKLS